MNDTIRVGYARYQVDPDESIPLSGHSNEAKRFHETITQPICATAVALSDSDDTTVLMVGMDICIVPTEYLERLPEITAATGVPADRIYLAATHTHASPGVGVAERFPAARRYSDKFFAAIIDACKDALADRKAATIYTGSIETQDMNFIKHYKVTDPADDHVCYGGDVFPPPPQCTYLEHTTAVDPTMHIVRFAREGGKDVVVANFRSHGHFDSGGQNKMLSSGHFGTFRDALEAMTDCHAVLFQGACGNVNPKSRFPHEQLFTTAASYGMALAAWCVQGLETCMTQVPGGKIKTKQIKYFGKINHTMDHLAEIGKKIRQEWNQTFDHAKAKADGAPYGIRSPMHAGAIWWNSERTDEDDGWMILNAVSVGDHFAFVTFPGEMFDTISVRMEENSPFDTTMMLGYCCHHIGYMPSMAAWKYTSYETDITRFAPGTGESVADKHVEMLNELKNS